MFAGIGGIRTAFTKAGAKCVFSSDYNKYCQISYKANYGKEIFGDIKEIKSEDIPNFDILCGGFPCQPFSIAGLKHGFKDEKQGDLLFEIERILRDKRPKAFFLENVKNIKSHDKGNTWAIIEHSLKNLGYTVFSKVIDAKYFVPQHRERVFIVGFLKNIYPQIDFNFPEYPEKRFYELKNIFESNPDKKYTLSDRYWKYLQENKDKNTQKKRGFYYTMLDPAIDTYTRTLTAHYSQGGSEILIKQAENNPRKLTPRECARLMGFKDSFKIIVSDTQAYKQFGNSVVIPVVHEIAKIMLSLMKK